MSSVSKTWQPLQAEAKWYKYWLENGYFRSLPDPAKTPYTVVIPPPNVTGQLHMGHMLNNTIQDILVRKARMEGKQACWVPGTDHASIATEARVVAMLKEQGIEKKQLSRSEFLAHAWTWKEKYGGIILEQLKKIGCSCDWERTRFTMEESLSRSVIEAFVELHQKGHIYRGVRMVNWDPSSQTALSDEEVYHKEINANLYHIGYKLENSQQQIVVATTRPETIMGDAAIAVNPTDERYQHLIGKKAYIPLINKLIDIIADDYVDASFGTGCLKVTPAHDLNDYQIGLRHGLAVIDVLAADGTLNQDAQICIGQDRFVARKNIVKMLDEAGQLIKTDTYKGTVNCSERTHAVVEPRLSLQWFLKMEELAKPALKAVMEGEVNLYPSKFKNLYKVWMEQPRDWCISRQLWWGHQIPAYYLPNHQIVVAADAQLALEKARLLYPQLDLQLQDLVQDQDVLDTWFSSWLWPISVFDGINNPDNADISYYYPTNDLVTAPEILFFWVARMIMAGYYFRQQPPFRNVYLTGIVRDKEGKKMSKSLGNSPDPLELIEKYGADGVRTGMLFSSPAGNDLPFDEKLCLQGRNFANKLWNAFRLIDGWQIVEGTAEDRAAQLAIVWFEAKIAKSITQILDDFDKFRISDALLNLYNLVWDNFCAWFLEAIKPEYQSPIAPNTAQAAFGFLEQILRLAHPFMPFITEEIWQNMPGRQPESGQSICMEAYPERLSFDAHILAQADHAFDIVGQIRLVRNQNQIAPKTPLDVLVETQNPDFYARFAALISKLAYINTPVLMANSEVETVASSQNYLSLRAKTDQIFIQITNQQSPQEQADKLIKELEYIKGFLETVEKKLANDKFVANAKAELLEKEHQKKADALAKIAAIEQSLAGIKL